MGAAAAQVAGQLIANLFVAGLGNAIEQGLGGHDHAVHAVTTLGRLLVDERLLHRVRRGLAAQPFEGGDIAAGGAGQGDDAGAGGHSVDDHRTRPTLAQAAAVLGAVQAQVVAQDQQQRGVRHGADFDGLAVDLQGDGCLHCWLISGGCLRYQRTHMTREFR
ncbi:hypothetical protein D3C80_1637960 [compost metagenome]